MTQMISSKQAYVAVAEEEHDLSNKEISHYSLHGRKQSAHREAQWRPFSVSPVGLLFFVACLLCILAALIATWTYGRGHDGFFLQTTNRYIWVYGPTAIFILIISHWRLIDYHLKITTPWAELAKGPTTADRSLLLDYISPLLITTLTQSVSRGHVAVSMSIIGFLLLKVVTIASTGLLIPAIITIGPSEQPMLQTSQFDLVTNFSDYSDPGASPFYEAYAIMQLGLPLPSGLTTELLYETYKPAIDNMNRNTTYSVPSRAFAPRVSCEAIDVKPLIDRDSFGSTVQQYEELQIQNTSKWACPRRTGSSSELNLKVTDVASRMAPSRQLLSSFGTSACKRVDQNDSGMAAPYLVALSDVRYKQTFNVSTDGYAIGDMIEPESWDFEIPTITSFLCTIDYEMMDINVFYNMSLIGNQAQRIDVLGLSNQSKIANLSNIYFSRKLGYAAPTTRSGARDFFGIFTQFEDVEEPPHTALTMIANRVNSTLKHLLDHPEEFKNATEDVMNNMLLQIARKGIVISNTNSTFVATQALSEEYHTEERLLVQTAPFIVDTVGLFILVLITLGGLWTHPKSSLRTSPEDIATTIATLQVSKDLNERIANLAGSSEKDAKIDMGATVFSIDTANSSVISFSLSSESNTNGMPQYHDRVSGSSYAPLTLSKLCIVFTLFTSLAAIGSLEILQNFSDRDLAGIATIENVDSLAVSIYSRFLPALIALLIATMFNCLDFNTAMLAPYNHLAAGDGSWEEFKTPILAHVSPIAISIAFRRRYWAACLTGLGALVGSALTIVVSGLYTVEYVPNMSDIMISQSDSWNISYIQGFQTDRAATAISSLIESANLSYPQFTYEELAFPTLDSISGPDGNVAVTIPALRAELACEELPWEKSNASIHWHPYKSVSDGWSAISFNITVDLPESCQYGSCFGNGSLIRPILLDSATGGSANISYYAQAIDLHTGPWRENDEDCDIFFTASGSVSPNQPVNQPGCPSVLLVYGYFDGNDHSKSTWTSMVCEQKLQQINTTLTLSVPDRNILHEPRPAPDESTAVYLESGDNGERTFGWWLSPSMESSYIMFNESAIDPVLLEGESAVSNDDTDFSNFFRGAFFGKTPLSLETLQRNDTQNKALVFEHVQMFYRRYMAQYFSANLRVQDSAQPQKRDDRIVSTPATTGSFTPTTGVARLVQHQTPKTILQAMLSFMFVCAVLALWIGRYHNLVPWNPCTIAGVMVLFAGSRMCENAENVNPNIKRDRAQAAVVNGQDISQDATHEMTNFSKPFASVRDKDATISASGRDWKNENAKLRLGWWNNGVFLGSKRNINMKAESEQLRYGIDVI